MLGSSSMVTPKTYERFEVNKGKICWLIFLLSEFTNNKN